MPQHAEKLTSFKLTEEINFILERYHITSDKNCLVKTIITQNTKIKPLNLAAMCRQSHGNQSSLLTGMK